MAKKNGNGAAAEKPSADEIIHAAALDGSRLIGDLADHLIAFEKAAHHHTPFEKLDEEGQRERCEAARSMARALVAGTLQAIAARGHPAVSAKLSKGSFTVGESLCEVKALMTFDDATMELLTRGSTDAMIVFASAEAYEGPMATKPEPDQKALIDDDPPHDPETGEIKDDEAPEKKDAPEGEGDQPGA